jgi:copper chaperone
MIEFDVQAVSCGHCVRAVTEAVREVDPAAKVDVDLDRKKVTVESSADRATLARALSEAGYPPR